MNCSTLVSRMVFLSQVQELVSAEVKRERSQTEMVIEQHKQRLSEQQKAYKNLEDEFRMALRIEAERYQELHRSYNDVCSSVEASRQTAITAVQKEQRATSIVSELTAIVKEQKGRISELNRSKLETLSQLKVSWNFFITMYPRWVVSIV